MASFQSAVRPNDVISNLIKIIGLKEIFPILLPLKSNDYFGIPLASDLSLILTLITLIILFSFFISNTLQ